MSDYKYNPLIDEDEDDEDNLDSSNDQALALGRVVDESAEDFIDYEVLYHKNQQSQHTALRPLTLLAYNLLGDVATMLSDRIGLITHDYALANAWIPELHTPFFQAGYGYEKDHYCMEMAVDLLEYIHAMREDYLASKEAAAKIIFPCNGEVSYQSALSLVHEIVSDMVEQYKDHPVERDMEADPDGDDFEYHINIHTEAKDVSYHHLANIVDDIFIAISDRRPAVSAAQVTVGQNYLAEIMATVPTIFADAADILETKKLSRLYNQVTQKNVLPLLTGALEAMTDTAVASVGGAGAALASVGIALPSNVDDMPSETAELATVRNALLVCNGITSYMNNSRFQKIVAADLTETAKEIPLEKLFNCLSTAWNSKFADLREEILVRYANITGDDRVHQEDSGVSSRICIHQPTILH